VKGMEIKVSNADENADHTATHTHTNWLLHLQHKGLTDEEDTNEDLTKASEAHCLHVIGISAPDGGVDGGYVRAYDPLNDMSSRSLSVCVSVCVDVCVCVSVCVDVCICAWTYIQPHT
jgi:hypothetical protein